ncbi:MAG: DUF488 domain-containing protein [Candidatus Altiarchaeota archaeon]|nr:DUF488 domain-containing protein [Candidatus Altiarchaeota archaeon]
MKKMSETKVYTIGHSNQGFEEFLELLNKNGIKAVVDVRSNPSSRYAPQFNRDEIHKRLEEAGIEYVFMEDNVVGNILGGRPKDGDCYRNGKVVYERIQGKGWYKAGISELINIARRKKTAIMCSEKNPDKCHRHCLITQSLLNKRVSVFHILEDGGIEKAQRDMTQTPLLAYSPL